MSFSMKKHIAWLAAFVLCAVPARGFSLLGEFEDWQEAQLGFQFPESTDLGGPKNISEEYRYSTPILTYGFDASFVDYFGTDGMAAIDSAFQVFNDLPAASAMSLNLDERDGDGKPRFPLNVRKVNRNAARLRMWDLKTQTIGMLLEQLGLGVPERYTWILRDVLGRDTDPWTGFVVANYNFDPVTYRPTPYINGTLYSYSISSFFVGDTRHYDALEFRVDPTQPNLSAAGFGNMTFLADDQAVAQVGAGAYIDRLTRDDVGALRFLYSPQNRNYELAPSGSAVQGTFTGSTVGSGGSGGGGSPWVPVVITPPVAGGGTDPTGGGTVTNAGPAFINAGVRRGVDKITFVRADVDPILRRIRTPLLVRYAETVETTNGVVNQRVERLLTVPDIMISASNFGEAAILTRSIGHVNNSAIDGISGAVNGGPGNLDVGQEITFNNAGRLYLNPALGSIQNELSTYIVWASFDGTTNAPITFPQGRFSFEELQAYQRQQMAP